MHLFLTTNMAVVKSRANRQLTNSYSSYYWTAWQVSKGEEKVGKGIPGRS